MFICKHTGAATEETAANRERVEEKRIYTFSTNAQNKQFAKPTLVMNVIFLVIIDRLSLSMNIYRMFNVTRDLCFKTKIASRHVQTYRSDRQTGKFIGLDTV